MTLTLLEARVLDRLQALPRDRVEQVLDYIDFLTVRESTRFLAGRLTESIATLEVAEGVAVGERRVGDQCCSERAAAAVLAPSPFLRLKSVGTRRMKLSEVSVFDSTATGAPPSRFSASMAASAAVSPE